MVRTIDEVVHKVCFIIGAWAIMTIGKYFEMCCRVHGLTEENIDGSKNDRKRRED